VLGLHGKASIPQQMCLLWRLTWHVDVQRCCKFMQQVSSLLTGTDHKTRGCDCH
jgi:hypothetical protein